MNSIFYCKNCQRQMENWNRQFYCCDRNDRYCILCREKRCLHCFKTITKEIQEPRCRECMTPYGDMYYEPLCDKYFCPKCLVTRVMKQNMKNEQYVLPCGHQVFGEKLKVFTKGKFCFVCGVNARDSDYDLLNGEKCCPTCIKLESHKIENFILNCLVCGKTMKKYEEIGKKDDGFLICKFCVTESELEENRQKKEHDKKKSLEKNIKNMKIEDHFHNQNNINNGIKPNNYSVNILPPPSIKINYVSPENAHNIHKEHSPLKTNNEPIKKITKTPPKYPSKDPKQHQGSQNIFKSFSSDNNEIKQVDSLITIEPITSEKNIKHSPSPLVSNSEKNVQKGPNIVKLNSKTSVDSFQKTILEKFPSEKEEEENLPKCRLKKHLSIDTIVEKMKIKIEKEISNFITCNECEYEINESECFTIENHMKVIKKYCRLCYIVLTNSQSLGFHLQQSKLDISRNRRGTSNQKIPQAYSPGKSMPVGTPFLSTQPENKMKLSATNFDVQQKVNPVTTSPTVQVLGGAKVQECVICHSVGRSTISTASGYFCFNCHNKRK